MKNGGTPKKNLKPKYELVHTHISPAMLRKYIKAENLTVVEKITDKYDYFDQSFEFVPKTL